MEVIKIIATYLGYTVMFCMMLTVVYVILTTRKTYGRPVVAEEEPIYTESEVQELLRQERAKK
jgi:hypothetical protein